VSMPRSRACAWGLRENATWSIPGRARSATNRPRPVRRRSSSRRLTGVPISDGRAPCSTVERTSARVAERRGGCFDGLHDALIARAAAEHRGDALSDLELGGIGIRVEEVERCQQHPRRAEAALESVMLVKGLLERVELAVLHQALDREELRPVRLHG